MSERSNHIISNVITVIFIALLTIFVLFMVWPAHGSSSQITGTLKDSFGNGINGTLILQLPVPATDTTTGVSVSPSPITCNLRNGVVSNCPPVYDVANLQPQNLYYIARAYDTSGTLVFNGNYPITGTSYNLFSAVPTTVTTSNVSYINPATTTSSNTFCCNQVFTGQIQSTVATGSAPFSIASTTVVPNLNVNLLNGVTITGVPTGGQVLTGTSPTLASWVTPSSGTSSINGCVVSSTPTANQILFATSPTVCGWENPTSTTGLVFGSSGSFVNTTIGTSATTILTKAVTMPSVGCPCRALVSYAFQYAVTSQQTVGAWVSDGTNIFANSQAGVNAANLTAMGLQGQDVSQTTYTNGANITFNVNAQTTGGTVTAGAPSFAGSPYLHVMIVSSN